MDNGKISVSTKLIRVDKLAVAHAEYNKGCGGDSVIRYVSDAIIEKWERENVGKRLEFLGDKVVGIKVK